MTLSSSDRTLADPRRDGDVVSGVLDDGKFVVGESEVDGVRAGVAGHGSSSGSLVVHETNISVKQKRIATEKLMLYDKDMKNPSNRYSHIRTAFELGEAYASDIATWYYLNRDILPLIEAQRERRLEIEMGHL